MRLLPLGITAALLVQASSSMAAIYVAGYGFADNAFADKLTSSSGNYVYTGATLEDSVVGSTVSDYAYSFDAGAYLALQFTDNKVSNGFMYDLAIFELGIPDTFKVSLTIGGTTLNYTTASTGYNAGGYSLNVALVDLSDFGVAPGATISDIVLGMDIYGRDSGTVPSLTAVGALNSCPVPEPSTYFAGMSALGMLGLMFRRNRK